jgi:hypothetical protein
MISKLKQLLDKKKIDKHQYNLFLLFTQTQAAEFLKNQLLHIAMEESPTSTEPGFAWSDGRRSVWRDIQNTMTYIYQLLEDIAYDDAS